MINTEYFWINIIFLSIGTMSIRASFMFLSGKVKISDRVKEVFAFIPSAILPAMIAPMVFFHEGSSEVLLNKERLIVLVAASVVCYISKSMIVTVLFGLCSLFLVTSYL